MAAPGQDDRQACPKCLALVAAQATYCPECGAALGDSTEGSDQAVYQELTKANLARMRGNVDEGIDICLGVLRRFPNNASAHILLGDFYSDRNDLPKAAEWYEMAVDLSPDSVAAKGKLEGVRERMVNNEAVATAKRLGLPQRASHVVAYIVGVTLLIAIVGGASFVLGGQFKADQDDNPARVSSPVVLPGRPNLPQMEPLMVPSERALLQAIKARSQLGDSLIGLLEDPRTPSLTVTVRGKKDQPIEVLAATAVRDTFDAAPAYRQVTVRVVVTDQIVLVADVTSEAYAAAKGLSRDTDLSAFAAQIIPHVETTPPSVSPKSNPAVGL